MRANPARHLSSCKFLLSRFQTPLKALKVGLLTLLFLRQRHASVTSRYVARWSYKRRIGPYTDFRELSGRSLWHSNRPQNWKYRLIQLRRSTLQRPWRWTGQPLKTHQPRGIRRLQAARNLQVKTRSALCRQSFIETQRGKAYNYLKTFPGSHSMILIDRKHFC
jgi:hypothetical protein